MLSDCLINIQVIFLLFEINSLIVSIFAEQEFCVKGIRAVANIGRVSSVIEAKKSPG